MLNNFTAIDFETANQRRWSACQIGITKVVDGEVSFVKSYLIDPETKFEPMNIDIHGITPEDVSSAPNFKTLWIDEIEPILSSSPIVISHNADFDISVLHSCLNRYDIEVPKLDYFCTLEATKSLLNLPSYKLQRLIEYFGLCEDVSYHDAGADSYCCAILLLYLNSFFKDNLEAYVNYSIDITIDDKRYMPMRTPTNTKYNHATVRPADFECSKCAEDIDPANPFFQQCVVVTGDFEFCSRETLYQTIVNLGGVVKTAVSRKTDYLLVGTQDKGVVLEKNGYKSTKQIKAEEINEKAQSEEQMIRIVGSRELLCWLTDCGGFVQ